MRNVYLREAERKNDVTLLAVGICEMPLINAGGTRATASSQAMAVLLHFASCLGGIR